MRLKSRRGLTTVFPITLVALAGLVAGCGDNKVTTYPVSGQVLYNGQPLKGVAIAFHAVDPKNDIGYPPHADTDSEGKFLLAGHLTDDGAPAGEFVVTVAFVPKSADEGSDQVQKLAFQVPAKYQRKETSDIKVTVKPQPNTLEPFQLSGPPAPKR